MNPSTNTRSVPTTSTETKNIDSSNSSYVTQTDFSTTIKYLLNNFDDKFKEYLKETIADQNAKFDEKSEKQIQTLSLHIKEYYTKFSLKLDDQDNKISFLTGSYNYPLKNMSANKKFNIKVEVAKT